MTIRLVLLGIWTILGIWSGAEGQELRKIHVAVPEQENHRAPARRRRNCLWAGLLLVPFVVVPCPSWARDAEELLAELNSERFWGGER